MKIDSNQFINIRMIYDNLGNEISDVVFEPHAITGCDITSEKFNVEKVLGFKKTFTDPSNVKVMNATFTRSRFTC